MSGELLLYPVVGAIAGLFAGLLGIGGGLIIVPALAVLIPVPPSAVMHAAIGTSLASIVLTALVSSYAHHRRGALRWSLVMMLAPGLAAGALAGALVADSLRSETLRVVFALFLLAVAAQLTWGRAVHPHRRLPPRTGMTFAGATIGLVSGVVGIGGGTMTVPFLHWCNVSLKEAIAVSAACGIPIALAGAAGFIIFGADTRIESASGYVYWPAFIGIASGSIASSPAGAALAHRLPVELLKKIFAAFAALVALSMLWAAELFS